jgi:predicted nucleotidyltransferase
METDLEARISRAAEILKRYGATEVYVFGSAASGKMHPHSDVDLAMIGIPPEKFFRAMGEAYETLGMPLDLVDLSEDTSLAIYLRKLKDRGDLKRVA